MILNFRAWNKATKEMHEADDIVSLNFEKKQICVKTLFFGQLSYYDFDDIVLMQSTGLVDKNGKEIFEGDILAVEADDEVVNVNVLWDKKHALFIFKSKKYNEEELLAELVEDNACPIEIIGNIYKNPELLK
jgi:uncharacterized phage protein (TIGR01671 family)